MSRLALLRLADTVLELEYERDAAASRLAALDLELAWARAGLATAAKRDEYVAPRPVELDVRARRAR